MSKENKKVKKELPKDLAMHCSKSCPSKPGKGVCYVQRLQEDDFTSLCVTCGFTTNSYLVENSLTVANALASSPEMYKDLTWTDKNTNLVWMPNTMIKEDGSIVFLDLHNGSPKWCGILASGKKVKNLPKLDLTTKKYFVDFPDALEYVFGDDLPVDEETS